MKKILLLAVLVASFSGVSTYSSAQTFDLSALGDIELAKMAHQIKTIDTAVYIATYKTTWIPDTTNLQKVEKADVSLLIGKRSTLFKDTYDLLLDSLYLDFEARNVPLAQQLTTTMPYARKANYSTTVVGNYPQKETFTIQTRMPSSYQEFSYTDKDAKMHWQIIDGEKKNVQGYTCLKATCAFRGRVYTAWFTPEIPLSEGPYLFKGLPGLILEISDSQNEYVFTLSGFEKAKTVQPIRFNYKAPSQVSRKEFRKIERQEHKNPSESSRDNEIRATDANGKAITFSPSPLPHNPIEKE